jgi:hypothetical protein
MVFTEWNWQDSKPELGGPVIDPPSALAHAVFAVPFYSVPIAAESLVLGSFSFSILGSLLRR